MVVSFQFFNPLFFFSHLEINFCLQISLVDALVSKNDFQNVNILDAFKSSKALLKLISFILRPKPPLKSIEVQNYFSF